MISKTTSSPRSARPARIDPIVMSAMTGAGVGLGFAIAHAVAAMLDVPFGVPLAVALPGAMLLAVGAAILITRRRNRLA
jgi:alcohol dehydrogenase class IV